MDFYNAIQSLHRELNRVEEAIATLEGLISGKPARSSSRRGRTFMSAEERKLVSQRMKRYWATRRGGDLRKVNSTS